MTEQISQIDINTSDKRIQDCFKGCLYEIPTYQRPYAWNEDQLKDFWNDVVLNYQDYFLGATVTFISKRRELFRHTFVIIDGQQRLTTATIALATIRNAFKAISKEYPTDPSIIKKCSLGESKTQEYLVPEDDDGNIYPIIDREENIYATKVLNINEVDGLRSDETSHKKIEYALQYFTESIEAELDKYTSATDKIERLLDLRSNILRARVIQIELKSEEDGFLVFETLNTRGLDLELPDLIKNLIIKNGAKSDSDRKNISERWTALRDKIDLANTNDEVQTSATSNTFSRFIWQSWNSRRKESKEAKLFKDLKTELSSLSQSAKSTTKQRDPYIEYLQQLEQDAEIYTYLDTIKIQALRNGGRDRNFLKLPEVVDALRALKIFGVSVANSALLAAIRKYHEGKLSEADLKRLTQALEIYHFHYNALGAVGSNGGMRSRYNRIAHAIHEATSLAQTKELVSDLIDTLNRTAASNRLKERSETQFLHLFYTGDRLTSQDRAMGRASLIQYVLLKMAQSISPLPTGMAFQTNDLSIEHIKPKASIGHKANKTDPECSIGNLTILKKADNNGAKDKPFDEKRGVLKKSLLMDDSLRDWLDDTSRTEITESDISERSKQLRRIALDKVWPI